MDRMQMLQLLNGLVVMVLSLSVHECAHAFVARLIGDDTAERAGRLTLDPRAHIDPFGTLLIPALGAMSGVPLIGWARPVPTDPGRFRRLFLGRPLSAGAGSTLVALAGPLSNLALALMLAVGLGSAARFVELGPAPVAILRTGILVNLGLAVLNLIPLPPLDGSRLVSWLLPSRFQAAYSRLGGPVGYIVLMLLFISGAFRLLVGPVTEVVWSLVMTVAGA